MIENLLIDSKDILKDNLEIEEDVFSGLQKDNVDEFTGFQWNKLVFLNDLYSNKNTQQTYWKIFNNYIKVIEDSKNKDVFSFNNEEVRDLIISLPTTNLRAKKTISSLLYQYFKWAIERGFRNGTNPFIESDLGQYIKISQRVAVKKYHTIDDIFELCNKVDFNAQELAPLVMARYGIVGEELSWMTSLKYEDINRELREVYIRDDKGELVTIIPVDDRFIDFMDEVKKVEELVIEPIDGRIRKCKYKDNGYILRSTRSKDKLKFQTIYTIMNRVFKSIGKKRISFTECEKNRKLDLLFMIKAKNGKITNQDIKDVVKIFNVDGSSTAYIPLREDYISFIGFNDIQQA